MSRRHRLVAAGAATALVLGGALVGGSPAQAAPGFGVKGKVTGSIYAAKTDSTIVIPRGGMFRGKLSFQQGVGYVKQGDLALPTMTAEVTALGFIPTVAKIDLVQMRPSNVVIGRKGKATFTARVKLSVPDVRVDAPLLNGLNIVKDTCQSKPFTLKLVSKNRFSLNGKLDLRGTFAIPAFVKYRVGAAA